MAYVKLTVDSDDSMSGSRDRLSAPDDIFEKVSLPDDPPRTGSDQITELNQELNSSVTDDPILRSPPERVTIVRKKHFKKTISKKLSGAGGMLVTIAIIIFFANAAARGYLNGVLLLIQHTLNIKDSEVIFTDIMFDLGIVIGLVPGVMVRNHMDRPKTLAISTATLAVGCFMCAGPYFWFARNHHKYSEPKDIGIDEYELCGDAGVTVFPTPETRPPPENSQSSEFFVIFGSGLMGIGTALMFVVGLPFAVDAFGGRRTPLVTGILLIAAAAGVWAGEVFSFLIQLTGSGISYSYNTTSRWWLGFLLFGLFSLLFALVLCTFEDDQPPAKEDEEQMNAVAAARQSEGAPDDTDGFYYMRLDEDRRRNKRCIPFMTKHMNMVFLALGLSLEGAILTGYLVFQPQFMSVVTGQSLARAEVSFASVTLIPLIVGMLISAFYIQFVKLDTKQLCRTILIFNVLGLVLSAALFMFGCKEPTIYQSDSEQDSNSGKANCSSSCECNDDKWTPVCGVNDVTYLSPCQAGCLGEHITESSLTFSNCTCIHRNPSSATPGPCPAECNGYGWHMLLIFTIYIVTGIQFCAAVYVIFKVANGYQRVCALAFFEFTYRLIGNLPALGYFKFTLSRACLIWTSARTEDDIIEYNYDECVVFSTNSHHFIFTSLIILLKAFILVFYAAAFITTKPKSDETIAERETIRFTRLELDDENSAETEPPPTPI